MFTVDQEKQIFTRLAYKSALEVGNEFELEKTYKDSKAVRNAVMHIYRKVAKAPDKYGVGTDVVQVVKDAMANRSLVTSRVEISKAEKEIDTEDIRGLALGVRDKTFRLINRKLDRAAKSNKRLDAVSFRDLGIIAGIAFDKSQIIQGQATEHVAVLGKIDGNVNAADAINLVLQMRERNVAAKQK